MRAFSFRRGCKTTSRKPASRSTGLGRYYRTLTFQTLEPRELKAANVLNTPLTWIAQNGTLAPLDPNAWQLAAPPASASANALASWQNLLGSLSAVGSGGPVIDITASTTDGYGGSVGGPGQVVYIESGATLQLTAPLADGTVIAGQGILDLDGQTVDNTISLVGFAGTLTNSSGAAAELDGAVGGGQFAIAGSGNIDLAGAVVEACWTMNANSTLTLSGADYAGAIDVESGTVQLNSPAALTSGAVTINGGTLDLNGQNATLDSLQGYGGAVVNSSASATLTINDQNGAAGYHGSIGGNISLNGYGGSSSGYGGSSSGYGGSSNGSGGSSSGYGGSSTGYGGSSGSSSGYGGSSSGYGGSSSGYGGSSSGYGGSSGSSSGYGGSSNGYGGSSSGYGGSSSGYGGSSSGYGGSSSGYGGSSSGYGGSSGSSSGYGGSSSGYGGASSGYGGSSSGYGGSSSGYGGSNGYGGSSSGYGDPIISDFTWEAGPTEYTFTGTVTDPNQNPWGLTVSFGGLLGGQMTTVDSDGTFLYSTEFPANTSGTVTAQTVDYTDHASNVAIDYLSTSGAGNGYGGSSGTGSSSGGSSNGYGGSSNGSNGYGGSAGSGTGSNGYGGSTGTGSGSSSSSSGSGSGGAVPSVAVNFAQNAVQGSTPGLIDLVRNGDLSQSLTVQYQIDQSIDETALYGADAEYVGPNITDGPTHGILTGTATFEAGSAYADIAIDASNDQDGQINPIVSFALVNPDGSVPLAGGVAANSYVISNGSASVMLQTSLVYVNDGATVDLDEMKAAQRVIYQMSPFEDLSPQSKISYAITGGNSDNVFQINNSGQITLAQDASHAMQSQYELTIRAQGQCPNTNVSFSTITIQMVSTIGVYGDTEAVRGSNDDTITLIFRRFTEDTSSALNVRFNVGWGTPDASISSSAASINDFVQGDATATLQSGVITILPKGATRDDGSISDGVTATLTLKAAPLPDGPTPTGIDSVKITLLSSTDAAGNNYRAASNGSTLGKPTDASAQGYLWLYVLDGVTAFASDNANPVLADTATVATMEGNPGIDPNDVRQGGLGDCYFMAAELALAKSDWQQIEGDIADNGDGTFAVRLWNANPGVDQQPGWQTFNISGNVLSNGWNMAELSGDYDPNTGNVEIWPQLLEEAWAQMHQGYANIDHGSVAAAWMALTGNKSQSPDLTGISNQGIGALLEMALATGGQVSVATRKEMPGEAPLSVMGGPNADKPESVYFDHAYIVTGLTRDSAGVVSGVQLTNPWGYGGDSPDPILPLSEFSVLDGIFTLTE